MSKISQMGFIFKDSGALYHQGHSLTHFLGEGDKPAGGGGTCFAPCETSTALCKLSPTALQRLLGVACRGQQGPCAARDKPPLLSSFYVRPSLPCTGRSEQVVKKGSGKASICPVSHCFPFRRHSARQPCVSPLPFLL